MKYRYSGILLAGMLQLPAVFFSATQAADFSGAFSTGVSAAPLYTGSSHYVVSPLLGYDMRMHDDALGTIALSDGTLVWGLPMNSAWGIALLLGYDEGRDEIIKTGMIHRHKHNDLKGMGDLKGTLTRGIKLSYALDESEIYVIGSQAFKKREYGGEALGRTLSIEAGIEGHSLLTEKLTAQWGVSTTWYNQGRMQANFGVSEIQSMQTTFTPYRPGSGIAQVTFKTGIYYQLTSSLSLIANVQTYYLPDSAKESPLVSNRWNTISSLGVQYHF
ncbi:MipA/OmpV family protein [Pectobacterium carotovorum]|uniref:MipA/OmpV family protein n=1 Tax=Pectobacterium carotovorum TaxID=554 RepID=UPI003019411B